jgi:hypothetical protein
MSHPRTYWTADRSMLVEEGDARAASLAYGEADPIAPEHLTLVQVEAYVDARLQELQAEKDAPKPAPVKRAPVKRTTRKRA